MSLKAIIWVMEDAPVENQGELAVLYALADRANDDGTAAWPSQEWMAERARCTDRTVRNHLSELERRGVIRRGDQKLVSHLSLRRKPVVWDLNLSMRREDLVQENFSASENRKVGTLKPESWDSKSGNPFPINRP